MVYSYSSLGLPLQASGVRVPKHDRALSNCESLAVERVPFRGMLLRCCRHRKNLWRANEGDVVRRECPSRSCLGTSSGLGIFVSKRSTVTTQIKPVRACPWSPPRAGVGEKLGPRCLKGGCLKVGIDDLSSLLLEAFSPPFETLCLNGGSPSRG